MNKEKKIRFPKLKAWFRRNMPYIFLAFFLTIFMVVYLIPSSFILIRPGEAGIRFGPFTGTDVQRIYGEGMAVIPPWDTMYIYNYRLQVLERSFEVLASNGLPVQVTVSVRYRPKYKTLGLLHRNVGPGYIDKIVTPEVQSVMREIIGQYTPEEIYTTKRNVLDRFVKEALREVDERFIYMDDLMLKSFKMPESVEKAIESKLRQAQLVEEYAYIVEREKKEAERKRIEAQGIKDFQDIIAEGISDKLLQWRGIEATLKLSESPNSKVIVIGGNKNGLPIILNDNNTAVNPAK